MLLPPDLTPFFAPRDTPSDDTQLNLQILQLYKELEIECYMKRNYYVN